jgi:Na+/H+ antiporter NhaD/arsenite permease-like protein
VRFFILAIFAISYAGISSQRIPFLSIGRNAVALIGAVACVVFSAIAGAPLLSFEQSVSAIDLHTIALLFGMMLLAVGFEEAQLFAWASTALATHFRSPTRLLWSVGIGCGLLSAVLVNDAVCVLAPVFVMPLVQKCGTPKIPFFFAMAMGSNAGSALTLSGNPQNMLVAQLSNVSYRHYLLWAGPAALVSLCVTLGLLHFIFRQELKTFSISKTTGVLQPFNAKMGTLLFALIGCVGANVLGCPLSLSALGAGAVTLISYREKAQNIIAKVDYGLLVFFASLFILVASFQHTGFTQTALDFFTSLFGKTDISLTGMMLLGSQVVSNVPLILLLEGWIKSFEDPQRAWVLTALISTLAGNLTPLGSVANLIVMEKSQVNVGFFQYIKVGIPVTLISILAAWPFVYVIH